jgi:hypothetical protein
MRYFEGPCKRFFRAEPKDRRQFMKERGQPCPRGTSRTRAETYVFSVVGTSRRDAPARAVAGGTVLADPQRKVQWLRR